MHFQAVVPIRAEFVGGCSCRGGSRCGGGQGGGGRGGGDALIGIGAPFRDPGWIAQPGT